MSNKILVVEDSKVDQAIIKRILHGHDILVANDGLEALDYIETQDDIEIMILDLNMPRMNGFEVLENMNMKHANRDIATLILTNFEEIENEIHGLALGAVDFIRKPLNAESLKKRIEVHQNLIHVKKEIKHHNSELENIVRKRTAQLRLSRDITVSALVGLLEIRDLESSNHTIRTKLMMKALSEYMGTLDRYKDVLSENKIEAIYTTTALHDIGKVGVPDKILLKPGKLSEEEFNIMKSHVEFGIDALTQEFADQDIDLFMQTALNIIQNHHEKYDGTGYPQGTCGEDIPIEGRMMAMVDVYDALTSKRVYKEAFSHEKSMNIMREEVGHHFDPEIFAAFENIESIIQDISNRYASNRGE